MATVADADVAADVAAALVAVALVVAALVAAVLVVAVTVAVAVARVGAACRGGSLTQLGYDGNPVKLLQEFHAVATTFLFRWNWLH